jgi:hypothetical protein
VASLLREIDGLHRSLLRTASERLGAARRFSVAASRARHVGAQQ